MSKLSEEHILRSLGLGFGADDDDFDDEAALQGVDSDPEELTVRRGMERSFFFFFFWRLSSLWPLVQIAVLTAEAEILKRVAALVLACHDVLHMKA